jgi:hypothetical protein
LAGFGTSRKPAYKELNDVQSNFLIVLDANITHIPSSGIRMQTSLVAFTPGGGEFISLSEMSLKSLVID